MTQHMLPDILRLDTVIGAEKPISEEIDHQEIDHRDDTDANSFQREIVDRALSLYYILTDLEQRDEPFSDHSLNSILQ